jgi:hypothetical protein
LIPNLPYGLGLGQEFAVLDCSLNYLTTVSR